MKIAIVGKGGVGKSFITYALANFFAKKGKKVLVVDCDESNLSLFKLFGYKTPSKDFMDFLGGKKTVKQQLIKRLNSNEKEFQMRIIDYNHFTIQDIPREYIQKNGNITLVSIGKIKSPMEGCACPMGVVSKEFLASIMLKHNELILVDTEAGVEHFGRGVEKDIDVVVAVAEPYLDSIDVAQKAMLLSNEMQKISYLIINKVPPNIKKILENKIKELNLNPIGFIPFYDEVYEASLEGKAPKNKKILQAIEQIGEKILCQSAN